MINSFFFNFYHLSPASIKPASPHFLTQPPTLISPALNLNKSPMRRCGQKGSQQQPRTQSWKSLEHSSCFLHWPVFIKHLVVRTSPCLLKGENTSVKVYNFGSEVKNYISFYFLQQDKTHSHSFGPRHPCSSFFAGVRAPLYPNDNLIIVEQNEQSFPPSHAALVRCGVLDISIVRVMPCLKSWTWVTEFLDRY